MTFKIFTPPHTLFAANILVEQLNKLGYEASITGEIKNDDSIYIIYNASTLTVLPKSYIVLQTEISTSHWFNNNYLKVIKGAIAVWDYSAANVGRYRNLNKNISIVPPGISIKPSKQKDIPLLFYGWINGSHRREKLLQRIERNHKIKIVTNSTGEEMWDILSRTKTVLNIHYYINSPLEIFRINEALSFGCHVISEPPFVNSYSKLVHFYHNDRELDVLIKQCSETDFDYDLAQLDNLESIRGALKKIDKLK